MEDIIKELESDVQEEGEEVAEDELLSKFNRTTIAGEDEI